MTSSTRLAVLLGLQLAAGAAFLACGSDSSSEPAATTKGDAGTPTADTSSGNNVLALTYSPMYSAFVEGGAHEAQVPVMLKDTSLRGKGATFTSSDPTIATVANTDTGAMVTIKKDGVVTIKASLGSDTGNARLTITKFTEAQWMAGQARYSKSDLALVSPDGGTISALTLASPGGRNANGACNTCHTAQAKTLKIENTPTQIAGYSDDELITIFTMGKKPDSAQMKSQIPSFVWGMFHTWQVTDDEKQGLIAYLRTQAPKDNPPMIDYGVKPCPGQSTTMLGAGTKLCDNDGNPVSIPGVTNGTTTTTTTDAGSSTTTTTTASDAGSTTTTADAGAAHDAG